MFIMKNYLKVLLNLSLATVFLVTNISANISMWPSGSSLNQGAKQSSMMFRLQNGSNRISEFQKIANAIFSSNQQQTTSEQQETRNDLTVDDMIKILGTPNKASANHLQYWLLDDETKQTAILYINNNIITSYQIINKQ